MTDDHVPCCELSVPCPTCGAPIGRTCRPECGAPAECRCDELDRPCCTKHYAIEEPA